MRMRHIHGGNMHVMLDAPVNKDTQRNIIATTRAAIFPILQSLKLEENSSDHHQKGQ